MDDLLQDVCIKLFELKFDYDVYIYIYKVVSYLGPIRISYLTGAFSILSMW